MGKEKKLLMFKQFLHNCPLSPINLDKDLVEKDTVQ
jgi:hypothetical protein